MGTAAISLISTPASKARNYDNPTISLPSVLAAGRASIPITILSDSTDTSTSDWGTLLASGLASKYPQYSVKNTFWDTGNSAWYDNVNVQVGASGSRYLLSNGSGQTSILPAAKAATVTGDIDIHLDVAPTSWNNGSTQSLFNKMSAAPGNFCFRLQINNSGGIQFNWSADGTNLNTVGSPDPGFVNGSRHWIRVTMDIDNGSSQNVVRFYTSSDGISWSQLGTDQISSGTTSLFNSSADWELFGWGNSIENWPGKIYNVRVKDGINGNNRLPQEIEYWFSETNEIGGIISIGGAPTLRVQNGGYSGATIDTWSDSTRLGKALNWSETSLIFVSLGHNEGSHGSYYTGRLDSLLSALRSKAPNAEIVMIAQNPRIAPAGYIWCFDTRHAELLGWCRKNGLQWVNIYRAFFEDGRALNTLINPSDGIHPTQTIGAGHQVWANGMYNALFN